MIVPLALLALFARAENVPIRPPPSVEIGTGGGRGVPAETAEARIVEIRRQVAVGLVGLRPWLAHERGWGPVGVVLGRYGSEGALDWARTIQTALRDLEAVDQAALSPTGRAEHASLVGWLQAERVLADFRTLERRDPVSYVDRVDRTLHALVASDTLAPMDRQKEVILILQELPKYWENARRSLSAPVVDWSLEAMPRLMELFYWMQRDLAASLGVADLPPRHQESFDQCLATAMQATLAFNAWLAESPVRSGEAVLPLEEGAWAQLVIQASGTELAPAAMKERVLRRMAELDAEGISAVSAGLADAAEEEPAAIAQRIAAAAQAAMSFAAAEDLVPRHIEGLTRLQARVVADRTTPGPVARSFFGQAGSNWLEVEPDGIQWPEEVRLSRARLFTRPGQETIGIRYGYPGEMLARFETDSAPDRHLALVASRVVIEGWGLYVLDWLPRISWASNPYARNDELQSAFAYSRLLEAARFLASLELHHERMDRREAADAFARRTGFDSESAEGEIRRSLRDPLHGIGFLGYLELQANEQKLAESSRPEIALLNNVGAILAHPCLRPADLRGNLFPYVLLPRTFPAR
ncbi:MAG: DUF885 family protein [Planctomycetota bacterium]